MKAKALVLATCAAWLISGTAARAQTATLSPDSRQQGQAWAYTFEFPGRDWQQADFDDSRWGRGPGGFGRQGTPGAVVRTPWHTRDVWLRREFDVEKFPAGLSLVVHHDEDVEVYLNGRRVHAATGYLVEYTEIELGRDDLAALKVGQNVLAVHCRQTGGGQYIDAGLVARDDAVVQSPTAPDAIAFFEKQVQPLLKASCLECHGDGKRLRGGLSLKSRADLLRGGDTGPAVDLKAPDKSLILKMVNYADDYHQMPPQGKLAQPEIDAITRWVRSGAAWTPGDGGPTVTKGEPGAISPEDRDYWAYNKPVRPEVPAVRNKGWVRTPVDAFLLARLEEKGLAPAPPLDRAGLIRRAAYDLTGLPPTPEEVDAFVQDESPEAYPKLLDRLLASPHYGEKWGRHWLDLVRYAETNGYEYDEAKSDAWKYRDYVVRAFNEDKPYDRFLTEQLAGDELPDADEQMRIATVYYRLGIYDTHAPDALQRDFDMYDDIVKTTSEVMLGMTMGCARCHDHKKDPIPQKDYYRFLAFVRNVRPGPDGPVSEHGGRSPATHVLVRGNAHVEGDQVGPAFPAVLGFPEPDLSGPGGGATCGRRLALAQWIASKDNPLTARVMVNRIWQHHFGRGIVPTPNDFGKLGEPPTHPDLLDWLAVEFMNPSDGGTPWSVKRLHKLLMTSSAYLMSSKNDPQAAAADPNNALYWRFNTRRLSAEEVRDSILAVDGTLDRTVGGPSVYPELPVEVIRTSSRFDRKTGFIDGGFWHRPRPEFEVRRSLYTFVRRSLLPPLMTAFDLADTDNSCAVRFTTTVPTQALTTLNSKFMQDHSRLLAERVRREAGDDVGRQVHRALRLATQNTPTEADVRRGVELIRDLRADGVGEGQALQYFCLVALNLNEFMYID